MLTNPYSSSCSEHVAERHAVNFISSIPSALPPPPPQDSLLLQAIASVDREEMFAEHMKERERRKRAEEKAARKRKLQDFRELLERTSDIKVYSCSTYYQYQQLHQHSTQSLWPFCVCAREIAARLHPSQCLCSFTNLSSGICCISKSPAASHQRCLWQLAV